MGNNQKGITEIAFQRLNNDELMERKYSSPEAILKYLRDNSNFRTLSSLIKDTMIDAGVCDSTSDDRVFKKILTNLLFQVESEWMFKVDKNSIRKRVDRWIKGEVDSIRTFNFAIEICYALNLDIDQTNTFLNKCGFSSLNVRNAEHAVHYYCILNHKSLETANKLLNEFEAAKYNITANDTDEASDSGDGTTTTILWRNLTNWETDEAFLNSFLIPNKYRFIGYSRTSLLNYYRTKNVFMTSILIEIARNDNNDVHGNEGSKKREFCEKEYPFQYRLRSSVRNLISDAYEDESSILKTRIINKIKYTQIPSNANPADYQSITVETMETFSCMKEAAIEINDLLFQYKLSCFIKGIITFEGAYKVVLRSLLSIKDGRKRPLLKESFGVYSPIFDCFPTPESVSEYESNPVLKDSVLPARKLIILMYFSIFCYELVLYFFHPLEECQDDTQMFFQDISFSGFINQTNKALKQSSLSVLYPPNQFDCMILMIVRKLELSLTDDDYDAPLDFFNEILKRMFLFDNGMD